MAWLTGWNYRKTITISNTGLALTDYQVLITIDTASLVTSGKMLSDCSDIRFRDSSDTNLDYWIESGANSSNTKIWVKIPNIYATPTTTTVYMYYDNSGATILSNYFNTFNILGDSSSGSLTVTALNTVINNYTYLSATGTSGSTTIFVNSGTGFSNGDEILIIQMKDVTGSSAGIYEFRKILSGGGTTTFTLITPLKNTYISVTQVVRIPQYADLTVNSGASITASSWNGNTGGIVAFRASGTLSIAGSIDVSNKGYLNGETYKGSTMYGGGGGAGGGGYSNEQGGGYQAGMAGGVGGNTGGIAGTHGYPGCGGTGGPGGNGGGTNKGLGGIGGGTPGSCCGGGGGGGGGGGNFYGLGGLGGGKGGSGNCYIGTNGSPGGTTGGVNGNGGNGGGGYGTNGTGGKGGTGAFNGSDGTNTKGGDGGSYGAPANYSGAGGGGGAAGLSYGSADLSTIFLGTSGGNVLANTGAGGIIIGFANTITITGSIYSNGSNANGSIGGSSGGSIYLTGNNVTIGSSLVSAKGGVGIVTTGGGGAGGDGRIRLSANSISGTSDPVAYTSGFDTDHNRKYASLEPTLSISGTEQLGITAVDMVVSPITCNSPCNIEVGITWQNIGSTNLILTDPGVYVNDTRISYGSSILVPIAYPSTVSILMTISLLGTGTYTICPDPN